MKRREFITLLGSAAATWPFAARAQQGKMATLGVLLTGAANPSPEAFLKGFRETLNDAGLVEGRSIRMEIRSAGGSATRLPDLAKELVGLQVDMIVAHLTPAVQAARQVTSDIPIVMAAAGDPLGTGLISSLARPGGNITGVSSAAAEVAGKSIELIHELFPSVRRVAVLANEVDPFSTPYLAQIGQAARSVGLEIQPIMGRPSAPQEPYFETMSAKRAEALIVQGSMVRKETGDLAIKHRLPSFASGRSWPTVGGLISYSASLAEVYRETAGYVDKILKGRKPADLPVSQPTKFELVINLKTAKVLGIKLPDSFLLRADEIIE
jgi:putative tryptophan/tyrosine transport system substrate-binding protein